MTTTKAATIQSTLEKADPNSIADALRYLGLGKLFAPITVTVTGLTASATVDITSAAVKAAAVIVGIDALDDGEYLPALGCLLSLRVTASGTAGSVGTYVFTDPSGTAIVPPGGASAAVGIAELSLDGSTITFPNTVTGFVLVYSPRPATAVTEQFATGV